MIDGISTRKRVLKTPFELYEIFYHDNFLNYVWRPKNWLGPNREKFVVPTDPNYMASLGEVSVTKENTGSWFWFHTLDDAAKHLLERAFCEKL